MNLNPAPFAIPSGRGAAAGASYKENMPFADNLTKSELIGGAQFELVSGIVQGSARRARYPLAPGSG